MVVRTYLRKFYEELQSHIDKVANKEAHRGQLSQAFKVLNNRVAIVGEITDDYMKRLARTTSPLTQNEVRERLKYVYRDILFVGTMSTVEYYFIRWLPLWPILPDAAKKVMSTGAGWERKVYLSKMIKWANKKNLIDDFYLWDFCVKLRNDIVHFDAIGRQTMKSPNIGHPVTMRQGVQASGVLRSFISLSRAIENSLFKFAMNLPRVHDCPK